MALFAGAGGGILGGLLLGWRTVCAVELSPYCRDVLLQRQVDGHLGRFPIWDDVRTFDGNAWRGEVDVISGGFPCQDISSAGGRAGIGGASSGLWKQYARIVGEVRPRHVFIENSPNLRTLGLVTVLQDLTDLGYDARWGVLGAYQVGAPHMRKRAWIYAADADRRSLREQQGRRRGAQGEGEAIVSNDGLEGHVPYPHNNRQRDQPVDAQMASAPAANGVGNPISSGLEGRQQPEVSRATLSVLTTGRWWESELGLARLANGMADRVERTRASGNGQVPAVAALAWRLLGPNGN